MPAPNEFPATPLPTLDRRLLPARELIRVCRQALFRWKIADSTGEELTGGQFLLKALILRRLLLREVLGAEERNIGILLPPTNGAAIVNAATALMGRVAVNLNYSVSSKVLNQCIKKAKIKHVLTSRKVIEKLGLEIGSEVFFLEDLKDKLRLSDKLIGAALAYGCPAAILDRLLGLHNISLEEIQTIIFTSGSTGEPKGVMLTGHNINCNVEAMNKVVHLRRSDVILGILPFFHSFGYTVTLWGPLSLDIHAAYHFSPLDARQVGKLAKARARRYCFQPQPSCARISSAAKSKILKRWKSSSPAPRNCQSRSAMRSRKSSVSGRLKVMAPPNFHRW